MTSDLAKLMATINLLQSEELPEPIVEIEETKVHPLLQAMRELREEGIVEAKESIKDQIEKAVIMDGGNIDEYFVRHSDIDKLGYSANQKFGKSIDLDHSDYDIDYVGANKGKPALWFYPLKYYLKANEPFASSGPHVWLVKLKSNAWLQTVDKNTKKKEEAPDGKERAGILRKSLVPSAIFFKPAFEVVEKFYDYGSQHKKHGEVSESLVEDTEITLNQLYKHQRPDDNERIYDYSTMIWDTPYEIGTISWRKLDMFLSEQYGVESTEDLLDRLDDWQQEVVDGYINDSNLSNEIIVLDNGFIVDGNHRAMAAVLTKRSIKYIDISDEEETIEEASPDTLEGSFTPDLVESKTWLSNMLAKGLKGKNAGTIYILGSWYGNMAIFLEQAGVKFKKIVLVEPDEESLMRSKELLDTLNDEGKLILIHQKAEDVVFEKPGVVINTSCNETGPVFLTKLPDNMLCLLQARNNVDNVLFETPELKEFVEYFPLETVYYTGEKELTDPETDYNRFMIIGRSGRKLDETVSTGQGGGSAGIGGGSMVGGPTTYEQEYDMFKSKGPRRITAMTNEALDSSYPYQIGDIKGRYYFETEDGIKYKVYFQGKDLVEVAFSAVLPGEENNFRPDKTTLTGTGNSRKVFGTVVNIIKEYMSEHSPNALYFTAGGGEPSRLRLYDTLVSQVDKALPDYYAIKTIDLGDGKAYMIKKKEEQVTEALDSSYSYTSDNKGSYFFTSDNGTEYIVAIAGKSHPQLGFGAKDHIGELKMGLTGTGDSRKIFGTVIQIVKDFVAANKPKTISFSSDSNEPSRLKLYKMLANKVDNILPNYELHDINKTAYSTNFVLANKNELSQ